MCRNFEKYKFGCFFCSLMSLMWERERQKNEWTSFFIPSSFSLDCSRTKSPWINFHPQRHIKPSRTKRTYIYYSRLLEILNFESNFFFDLKKSAYDSIARLLHIKECTPQLYSLKQCLLIFWKKLFNAKFILLKTEN